VNQWRITNKILNTIITCRGAGGKRRLGKKAEGGRMKKKESVVKNQKAVVSGQEIRNQQDRNQIISKSDNRKISKLANQQSDARNREPRI
jgi:hypothetical protein